MKLTIGADPEFLFMKTPTKLSSAHTETCFRSLSPTAKIGRDGARIPVEIRPSPCSYGNLEPFFKEIKALIKQMGRYVSSHEWFGLYGGSYPCGHPLGGHIHFGFNCRNYDISSIIRRLDDYLSPILLLLADKNSFLRRVDSGYGKLSKAENKAYGFEYRTPYCFLTTEEATKGIFTLAGLIVKKYKSLPNLKIRDYSYEYNKCNKKYFYDFFYKKQIRPNLLKIIKDTLSKHKKYQMRIYSVLNHVDRGNLLTMGNVLYNFFPDKFEKARNQITDYLKFGSGRYMDLIRDRIIYTFFDNNLQSYFKYPLYIYGIPMSHCDSSAIFIDGQFKSYFNSIIATNEHVAKELISGSKDLDFKIVFGRIGNNCNFPSEYTCGIGISRKIREEWNNCNFPLISVLVDLIKVLNERSMGRS